MTGVVLRCPGCGTTQTHQGECDACYEAQVRYFCDNHTPGVWLDQQQCKTCGARYGEAPKKRAPVSPVALPPARSRTAPRPTTRRDGEDAPGTRGKRAPIEPLAGHSKRPPDPAETGRPPDVAELIRRALGGRAHHGYGDEAWPRAIPAMPLLRLGGCLRKLILVVFIVLGLIVAGSFLLVGGALQLFMGG